MPEQTVVRTGETEVYSLAVSNSVFVYCVIFVGSDHNKWLCTFASRTRELDKFIKSESFRRCVIIRSRMNYII